MYWIVENFTKESSYLELVEEIRKQGHNLTEIKNGYKKSDLEYFGGYGRIVCKNGEFIDNPVIFQGSIEISKLIKKDLPYGCYPVTYCNFDNYLCSKYYSYFGSYLFNDKYAIISLKELERQRFLYWGVFGKEALLFIRPDSGEKPFQAQLLDLLDLDSFLIKHKDIEHDLVVISSPKNIRAEWRFIVSKYQEIIGLSLYKYQDQITRIPSAPKDCVDFVLELLKLEYFPDSVFCMDIVENNDGEFYLMELNSFSSAGLYACKKDLIVKRVSEIAMEDYKNYVNNITN